MKPKTALQKQIFELSAQLPTITEKQKNWASEKVFLKWGVVSRNKIHCLECGNSWNPEKKINKGFKKAKCPNCNSNLKMQGDNKVLFQEKDYCAIVTTKNDFQVVRMIYSVKSMKKNETPSYFHIEVMQHWIEPNGNVTSLARSRQGMSRYFDQWITSSELSIQPKEFKNHSLFYLNPYKVHPERKILPIIKRNGFKGRFHTIAPHELFISLLTDRKAENLLKTNQISALNFYIKKYQTNVTGIWNTIKICTKNNYLIKDFSIYKDYIDLLKQFGKDIHNPKYICPPDLNKAHDKLVDKKRAIERKENIEKIKKKIQESQKAYKDEKKAFFGLQFSKGNLTIKVIENVKDFLEEGDNLRHCVFTNEYYKKADSLILSATIGNKRVETIEISLSYLAITQSRGLKNQATKHHSKIIDLVNKNMPKIEAILKQAS